MKQRFLITLGVLAIGLGALVGCSTFVNDAQKSIYVAANLSDGAMKTYATYWKSETNRLGDTAALESQRSNVVVLASQVGVGIALADRTLQTYQGNIGTNTTTQAAVNAVIATAIERASGLAGFIGSLTGNTNFITTP